MSDTEHEDEVTEEQTTFTADPDEEEPDTDEDAEDEETEQEQEQESDVDSSAKMKQLDAYAIRARKYLAKNMGEVLEEAANEYTECPFCNFTNTPGFVHMSPCPPELLGVVHQWTNTASPADLTPDPHSEECPECGGHGKNLMPTKVPEQAEAVCVKCKGNGWLPIDAARGGGPGTASNGLTAVYPPVSEVASAVPETSWDDDPRVIELRQLGVAVIPPYVPAG